MAETAVLITGVNGGIGTALAAGFRSAGYFVIGTGRDAGAGQEIDAFVPADLAELARDPSALETFRAAVLDVAGDAGLGVLINNAAYQHVASTARLSRDAWLQTLDVNLNAPFFLTQAFLPELAANEGVVLNIGSVHARATKPGFAAYATSKAALHGMTRALAVDLGGQIRVVGLAPAAVATSMLMAGFEGHEDAFRELENVHPARKIAAPSDVADAALYLASPQSTFVTGTIFYLDGGILSRLHDPV